MLTRQTNPTQLYVSPPLFFFELRGLFMRGVSRLYCVFLFSLVGERVFKCFRTFPVVVSFFLLTPSFGPFFLLKFFFVPKTQLSP